MGFLYAGCYIVFCIPYRHSGGRMKKRNTLFIFIVLLFVFAFLVCGNLSAETANKTIKKTDQQVTGNKQIPAPETIEETFKKTFPRVAFDAIKPTNMKGIYEVIKGSEIIYFFSEKEYLFVGEIITKEGKSVTEERKGDLAMESAKNIPLEKAVKVGNGKNIILEFTDPDCPYCRTASSFLEQRKDVTRYIFFYPLPMHPDAENKIKFIFCAADQAKAYEDAMKGKLDDQKYEVCKKQEAVDLLKLHKDIGGKIGINGTPFFIINGKKTVVGANAKEIEAALNN
ncbi:MAG: protein-disulfide isomerase [Syntrophus sp. (in: bacteria)]|nr:protein-disulfide isomerase [Syntrophus sp. (in: bacteria)]